MIVGQFRRFRLERMMFSPSLIASKRVIKIHGIHTSFALFWKFPSRREWCKRRLNLSRSISSSNSANKPPTRCLMTTISDSNALNTDRRTDSSALVMVVGLVWKGNIEWEALGMGGECKWISNLGLGWLRVGPIGMWLKWIQLTEIRKADSDPASLDYANDRVKKAWVHWSGIVKMRTHLEMIKKHGV